MGRIVDTWALTAGLASRVVGATACVALLWLAVWWAAQRVG